MKKVLSFLFLVITCQFVVGQGMQTVFVGFNNNISQLKEIGGALNNEANFGAAIGYNYLLGAQKIRWSNTVQATYLHNTLSTNINEGDLRKYYFSYTTMIGFFPNDRFGLLVGPTTSILLGTNDITFQEGSHLPLDVGATFEAQFLFEEYRFSLSYTHGFLVVDEYRLRDINQLPIGIATFKNRVLAATIGYNF